MKLGANETLLKSYDGYSTSDSGVDSLIVTDKRIIRQRELKTFSIKRTVREEIRTQDVVAVNSKVEVRRKMGYLAACIIFAVLAIAALVTYFLLPKFAEVDKLIVDCCLYGSIALFVLAIIFLLLLIFAKRIAFQLVLSTNQIIGNQMAIGTMVGMQVVLKKNQLNRANKALSDCTVAVKVVAAIAEEIGALIVQAQDRACPIQLIETPVRTVPAQEVAAATASVEELVAEETVAEEAPAEEEVTVAAAEAPVADVVEEDFEVAPEEKPEDVAEEAVEELTEAAPAEEEAVVEEVTEELAVEETAAEAAPAEAPEAENAEEPAPEQAVAAFEEVEPEEENKAL